jgi:hypothetical protein
VRPREKISLQKSLTHDSTSECVGRKIRTVSVARLFTVQFNYSAAEVWGSKEKRGEYFVGYIYMKLVDPKSARRRDALQCKQAARVVRPHGGAGDKKTQPSLLAQPSDSDAARQKALPNTEAQASS